MTSPQQQMLDYLRTQLGDAASLDADTPLVSSGLIDSFVLVAVLMKLEEVTHRRLPPGEVQPKDLETVRVMFEMVNRIELAGGLV